jgi:mannose-6-phosphate isomerase-like protein (cupin superfamily)
MRLQPLLAAVVCVAMATQLPGEPAAATSPADHPIVNTRRTNMSAKNRPAWSQVTGSGLLKGVNSGQFDRHYHDCNEYWLVAQGKAKIWIDGKSYYVRDGDIVCIKAGLEHDILELYEPLVGFYFEDALLPGGKAGHLHKTEEFKKKHPVPTLPVPADFPKD